MQPRNCVNRDISYPILKESRGGEKKRESECKREKERGGGVEKGRERGKRAVTRED